VWGPAPHGSERPPGGPTPTSNAASIPWLVMYE